ncbi:SAM-dependent methyltransferase [Piscinibacter koreensis]|uniref:Methyltransferase domain-containing protein n=1 Tax=Piscinibacter koreensis TaxID=2742824 RepID=A0A7Y6TWA5_9BURK|nr:methyltransferase domain-containing protein [Schlegelella koreensis]NUZ05838.1 methyltransferase domain-containing protein [Schlegelella koreensis]
MTFFRPAWAVALAVAAAGAAAQEEVPFVTSPDRVTLAMLEIANVGARDHVVDLGSGDGRIVVTAARRFGASGFGVEIVPDLVSRSRANARAAGVEARVEFREQDLFATDLAPASVVTMYLLPDVNLALRPRLLALAPGTRVVSHDWDMGDWTPDRTLTIDVPDKPIGRERVSRVHLWTVPARVHGLWCGADASLDITQRFQRFSATLTATPRAAPGTSAPNLPPQVFDGRVDAASLRENATDAVVLVADADGRTLRSAADATRRLGGAVFTRAPAAGCR